MKLDHSEFIARHHKKAQPENGRRLRRKNYAGLLAILTLSLFGGILLFLASVSQINEVTRLVAVSAFLLAALVIFVVYRSYRVHSTQEKELDLIHEVMEGSRGARLITDSADDTVYYNRKFEELCRGVGAPGFKSLTRLFQKNEEAQAHFRGLSDQAHRGLTDTVELFSRFEDRERWLSVTAQPIADRSGYVHWRVDDVTQKHMEDNAVREEREKLIDFTDNAPVGFFSVNENGRFVFANATFARWLGVDLRSLLEKGVLHTYLADPPQNARPYGITGSNNPREVAEVSMKGAGGKTFLASVNQVVVSEPGGRVRTRAVVHDLTTEREMYKALKASEDRFQRFFEEAPLGIILVDNSGKIADCNNAFAMMLGTEVVELEGLDFEELIHEDDCESVLSTVDKIEQGKQLEAPLEITLKAANENFVEAQMYARRFKGGNNTVLHFIDLTEQKQLEAQFVQSQKMQAIGQLAGGVAHDFNNLLTAIVGFCDLLLLRHKPGDPSFGDIMQIKQNSNRAANLVRQLLAFSRQQTLRPRVHDATDILTEVSHLLRRLIGANIDLKLLHGKDLGLIKVDEGQMEQVLINLAVNARDAMRGGGSLMIETRAFANKSPKELISEELPVGEWVLIKVSDTGCGIPKKNLSRIFEPFFTTKDVGEGTGLGLATVYGIIRQTDGYLDVESKPDKGTTFFIYLPRASETEVDEAEEDFAEENMTRDLTGTERILLVEDEDAVRTFSKRALSNKGYEVLDADSGESALSVLNAQENKHLDLIITDVVMPNMDGPTLAQRIRQNNPDLKIIFISGYSEDKLRDYMGPNTYFLPKPFTLKQLAFKVKEVLEE